jgi:hypothetical protein
MDGAAEADRPSSQSVCNNQRPQYSKFIQIPDHHQCSSESYGICTSKIMTANPVLTV